MKVYLTKRGRVWHCYYRRNGRTYRQSLRVENRKIAEDLRRRLEWKLNTGEEHVDDKPVAIDDFLEEFREHSLARKRKKSHATDMNRLQDFLDTLAVEHIQDVTVAHVSRYLARKVTKGGAKPATVLRYREILHAFFNHAKRLGYLSDNPVAGTPRPRLPRRDPRFLSKKDIRGLRKAVKGDQISPLVATLVYAGLRRHEVCWLTWDDVVLEAERPVLKVRAKTVNGESWRPKTDRDRAIPISRRLRRILKCHKRNGTPWVFPSPQGTRWDPDNLSWRFRTLMKDAELSWNFLDLRHTFGSHLAMNGVSLVKIARLMGNSPEIASRHYINLVPEEMAADVEF